jgi:formate dehydrogenase iron-sulfur subunit
LGEARLATEPFPSQRYGFFTDSSICIGCKACEVACKEWNDVPEDGLKWLGVSYDNTGQLGANSWRHVAFIEEKHNGEQRWLMNSDVCKHCTEAACLEVCPTGALFRTEFGTVVVQEDVCNGCGYCVVACPFGVIGKRERGDGMAHKCTLCYDRLGVGVEPACAKACPTQSIRFGTLAEMQDLASARVERLHAEGAHEARLYGMEAESGVGGTGSVFLLLGQPEKYGLPSDPLTPTRHLRESWAAAATAGAAMILGVAAAFVAGRR